MPLRWFKFSLQIAQPQLLFGQEQREKRKQKENPEKKFLEKENLFKKGFYFSFRTEPNLIWRISAIKTVKVQFGQDKGGLCTYFKYIIILHCMSFQRKIQSGCDGYTSYMILSATKMCTERVNRPGLYIVIRRLHCQHPTEMNEGSLCLVLLFPCVWLQTQASIPLSLYLKGYLHNQKRQELSVNICMCKEEGKYRLTPLIQFQLS